MFGSLSYSAMLLRDLDTGTIIGEKSPGLCPNVPYAVLYLTPQLGNCTGSARLVLIQRGDGQCCWIEATTPADGT
jgi:hypothetical protein